MIEEQKEFLAAIISTKRRGRGGARRGFSRIIVKNETRACRIYVDFDLFDLGRATFLCGLEVPGRKRTGPGGFYVQS